jgi:hypothetical protein
MVFNKNTKKGQAAIEFLMTYGWMLLVVLIVGALIFSFVDFSSLLPNKLDLSNNLRGSPTESIASSTGIVQVVFTYTGASQVVIGGINGSITRTVGGSCTMTQITNKDVTGVGATSTTGAPVTFLNGQLGIAEFTCTNLLKGDALDGTIRIDVVNPRTGLKVPSSGPIRLAIAQ